MFYVSGRSDGVVVEAAAQVVGAPAAAARWSHARRRRPRTSVAHRSAFIQTHWRTGATHRRGVGGPAMVWRVGGKKRTRSLAAHGPIGGRGSL